MLPLHKSCIRFSNFVRIAATSSFSLRRHFSEAVENLVGGPLFPRPHDRAQGGVPTTKNTSTKKWKLAQKSGHF
jgi:hypothetical protein